MLQGTLSTPAVLIGAVCPGNSNIIEKINYNGTELPVTDKTVYIEEGSQVLQYDDFNDFPSLGKPSWIYIEKNKNRTWRWDDTALIYYIIGSDYTQIEVINGGDANG